MPRTSAPSDAEDAIQEATGEAVSRLSGEADKLRSEIAYRQAKHDAAMAPLHSDLAKLEAWIATLRGTPARHTTNRSKGRARPRQNRNAILAALNAQPDLTSAQVAEATGIDKNVTNATLHKLHRDGLVRKHDSARGIVHRVI